MKLILAIIITTILVGGTTAFATYNYFAEDIEYEKSDGTKISVENSLNELYEKNNYIYEKGSFSIYLNKSSYGIITVNLSNTYTDDDNAYMILTKISYDAPIYPEYDSQTNKIIGNQKRFNIVNYAGDSIYSRTYTFNYKIIRLDE